MLLRNSHIKKPLRIRLLKCRESRSVRHRRRHSDNFRILLGKLTQLLRKHICVRRKLLRAKRLSGLDVKWLNSMKARRVLLRRLISLSLFRQDMNQNRVVHLLCFLENLCHLGNVVTIDRSEIGDSHILKEHARNDQLLDAVLCPADLVDKPLSDNRNLQKRVRHSLLQSVVSGSQAKSAQVL